MNLINFKEELDQIETIFGNSKCTDLENKIKQLDWISVKIELPKKNELVDIYSLKNIIEYNYEYLGEGVFYDNENDKIRDIKDKITHWRHINLPT